MEINFRWIGYPEPGRLGISSLSLAGRRQCLNPAKGPGGGLTVSPPLEKVIAESENEFVVASRLIVSGQSPRAGNPRVVAVVKLDKNIRVVPGPPPPLGVSEPGSSQFTESAPEMGSCLTLDEELVFTTQAIEEPPEPSELVEVIMDSEIEASPVGECSKTQTEGASTPVKKKRGRPPG